MDATRREAALSGLLDRVVASTVVQGTPAEGTWPGEASSDPVWDAALEALRHTFASRWDSARTLASALPAPDADDDAARWLHRGVVVWAAAGDPAPTSDLALVPVLDDLPDVTTPLGRFAAHLLVEGVLAHARLDLAAALVEALGDGLWTWLVLDGRAHPFGAMVQLCRVRVLAFRGELAAADAVLTTVPPAPPGAIAALLAATACLVRGNQADPADVRRLVAVVDRNAPVAVDHLTAGSQMLASFGLIALGDVIEAARRVLLAGGDAGLTHLDVVDRALGLEMLVVLALAADDLDAAWAWADQAVPLLSSPIADSTVARLLSRLALAEDRVDDAVAWGERAVARARQVDRVIEYAEGEIVLNRARILQRGEGGLVAAVRALEAMVASAEERGHRAARRSASRELRPIGVRLRPLAGSGWAGLSTREAEVARLVAEGSSNREIATRLHVSEHTVRAHVSRVLAAFGVATRAALPAVVGVAPGEAGSRPALTPRQAEVAQLVADGLSNRTISDRLGLSPRTVEKHVGDILMRWDLAGRTAIAREVSARRAG
ncbi:LuxR family transcriptional regulator [Nocardioides sp.]|uniref:helix-turn-helix transcriptional regulator n=1 Tax=Nocardioides sp. TaxID=35761 RepID=UPI00271F00F1|nr:LuxR family transcriptional regulator [Nocardioides sp.]MDO9455187.1 LuxR C-terminal-related transcriptional regulator [Nocardioides sp.]